MKDMAVPLDTLHLLVRRTACSRPPLAAWALALLSTLTVAWPAAAQSPAAASAAPETREMIEALKPGRQRNLVIRQTTPAAPAATASTPSAAGPAAPPALPAPAPSGGVVAPPGLPPAAGPVAPPALPAPLPATSPSPAPAPGQAPATADAPPSLSLAIPFESNSSRVRPESGPVLGNLVAAMLSPDLKNNRFVIEGHTDARGSAGANQALSQQRADEVRLFLMALGVHPARLRAVGKGSSEPANPRDPLAGENRRVRVVTLE